MVLCVLKIFSCVTPQGSLQHSFKKIYKNNVYASGDPQVWEVYDRKNLIYTNDVDKFNLAT